MIVAASTSCISNSSLADILDRFADMEYTHAELTVGEHGTIKAEDIPPQFNALVKVWRDQRRVTPVAVFFDLETTHTNYAELFSNTCKLAKALKIITVTVRSSVPGTPFNEEVERLRVLTNIGTNHGVVLSLLTETGRLSEAPETVGSFCKTVKGLGVTLDPSYFVYNTPKPRSYELLADKICHVRLRDSSKDQFQTRVGQGVIDFGRLVIHLNKVNYRRVLCVDLAEISDTDISSEIRKMRLLLESLL